jgi:hypothetical protein
MIHLKLIGGLGNQLFQIAYAYDLSKKTGKKINVDRSEYDHYKIREFDLDKLLISDRFVYFENRNWKFNLSCKVYRIYQKLVKNIFKIDDFGKVMFNILQNLGMFYNFDPFFYKNIKNSLTKNNLYIYGYFQSESYFFDNRKEIKKILKVKSLIKKPEQEYLNLIMEEESIAISLRLGKDYFESKNLNVCDDKFYLDSLKVMLNTVGNKNIFVFSDEVIKAKALLKNFNHYNITYIENQSPTQSLRLMYNCSHFIIPNSSFSWWGAYLSDFEDKLIIAPHRWYNYKENVQDIYSNKMKRISEYE